MTDLKTLEVWFVTGSQHLHGPETLQKVAANAQTVAASLAQERSILAKVVFKALVTAPEEIRGFCREANNAEHYIGLILWMHTFSPANMKVARFGDNMREVAVTEGDKVAAQAQFGFSVYGYGVGGLVACINQFSDAEAGKLVAEYRDANSIAKEHDRPQSLSDAARIELGLRALLQEGGFGAFTDTFEDLHGMKQLQGSATQRLMADGYGFGGEGDWKTAALVRIMKVMAQGMHGGTSFMEDYTYDFSGTPKVLGSHMLEICPSIATDKPSLEVHPLGIGGKDDPVRLVFTAPAGPAINASIIDMGTRFRMLVNEVDVVKPGQELPKRPVARALWVPKPNLKIGAAAWIYAGGAHRTGFSQALTTQHMEDFAKIAGIECIRIDADTKLHQLRQELRWNDTGTMWS